MSTVLKVADLFCGAGGSSTGLLLAARDLGFELDLRVINHLLIAIETHKANHPAATHVREDIYKVDPHSVFPEVPRVPLDLLWASPTCTFFSRARGGRPVSWDQRKGRMTPWQVRRWVKALRPRFVIVENVPEFREWGPVCKHRTVCQQHNWPGPTKPGEICGKPRKNKAGIYFRRWRRDLELEGYSVHDGILCAANFGDPTTRERYYLVACLDGDARELWPAPTHSQFGSRDLFGATLPWVPARAALDFSIPGRSIFNRPEDELLSKNTHKRVLAGAVRFDWPRVFADALRLLLRFQGVSERILDDIERRAREASARAPRARTARAALVRAENTGGNGLCVRSDLDPAYTVTTNGGMGLAEPVLVPQRSDQDPSRSVRDPLPTIMAVSRVGLAEPLVLQANQGAERARNIRGTDSSPLQTVVTGDSLALAEPFVLANRTNNVPKDPAKDPLPTATTSGGGGIAIVEPFALSQGAGGAARPASEPLPTIPTRGAHAIVMPYGNVARSAEDPLATLTTRDRHALLTPVTHTDESMRARSLEQPFPTLTGAARGELAFFAAAFGERPGQLPRTHSVDAPAPTIPARGRLDLVQAFVSAHGIDITYRMVQPRELSRAMSFPADYIWPGNKTQTTRLIGNAVAVEQARALGRKVLERILVERRALAVVPA